MKEENEFRKNLDGVKSILLAEAYTRKDNSVCILFLTHLQDTLNEKESIQVFEDYCNKNRVSLEIVAGEDMFGGYFDLSKRVIVFQITKDLLYIIGLADKHTLESLANILWVSFTHEDTHHQQCKSSKAIKHYVNPTSTYWNEDIGKNISYFNQTVEADAYGREIAARLEKLYPEDSVFSIFLRINSNKIDYEYTKKIINVYRDPRINDKANKAFFRALYDFLETEKIESN